MKTNAELLDMGRLPLTLSIAEVAQLLDSNSSTVRKAINAGDIPTIHIGGRDRVSKIVMRRLLMID
jgi:excisionase family DNA binding protein